MTLSAAAGYFDDRGSSGLVARRSVRWWFAVQTKDRRFDLRYARGLLAAKVLVGGRRARRDALPALSPVGRGAQAHCCAARSGCTPSAYRGPDARGASCVRGPGGCGRPFARRGALRGHRGRRSAAPAGTGLPGFQMMSTARLPAGATVSGATLSWSHGSLSFGHGARAHLSHSTYGRPPTAAWSLRRGSCRPHTARPFTCASVSGGEAAGSACGRRRLSGPRRQFRVAWQPRCARARLALTAVGQRGQRGMVTASAWRQRSKLPPRTATRRNVRGPLRVTLGAPATACRRAEAVQAHTDVAAYGGAAGAGAGNREKTSSGSAA